MHPDWAEAERVVIDETINNTRRFLVFMAWKRSNYYRPENIYKAMLFSLTGRGIGKKRRELFGLSSDIS